MNDEQQRTFELADVEIRMVDGQAPVIAGYAVVFDSWSETMIDSRGRAFRERFAPGAFDRALAGNPDIRALWSHDQGKPLGRTRNGTLRLRKDGAGLRFELDAPPTTWGADAVASIRRGDVTGMSFAFLARGDGRDTWERGGADGVALRTVLDADLLEVSPVAFPAYPATSVAVRAVSVPDGLESDGQEAGEIARQAEQQALRLRVQVERELMNWE